MNPEDLNELKAYKMGYDLGWYRATEALMPLLHDLEDCMANSATWRQIEKETNEQPIFIARIAGIICDLRQIQNEHMPAIVLEQKAINDMGSKLAKLTKEDWKVLGTVDNSSLDLSRKSSKKLSENN